MMTWNYIAGFWDGEGTIAPLALKNRSEQFYIGACQSTPQAECLNIMGKFLMDNGIPTVIYVAKYNGPNRHPISKLVIRGGMEKQLEFLERVKDHLIVKRKAAEYAILSLTRSLSEPWAGTNDRILAAWKSYSEDGLSIRDAAKSNRITGDTLIAYISANGLARRSRHESLKLAYSRGKRGVSRSRQANGRFGRRSRDVA